MDTYEETTLRVGAGVTLRRSFFGASFGIVYAGQVSETTYSVAVTWSYGYQSRAYNLFFSDRQTEIELPQGRLSIARVSAEEITFRYQR